MGSPLILIVEDDQTLAHAIERNLAVRGYATRRVGSVADATEALHRERPGLVLLDIDLPDGSGWEILRDLRERGCEDTGVIVMSALRPNSRLVAELHCTGVLEKPFPMDSLLRLVARLTGQSGEQRLPDTGSDG